MAKRLWRASAPVLAEILRTMKRSRPILLAILLLGCERGMIDAREVNPKAPHLVRKKYLFRHLTWSGIFPLEGGLIPDPHFLVSAPYSLQSNSRVAAQIVEVNPFFKDSSTEVVLYLTTVSTACEKQLHFSPERAPEIPFDDAPLIVGDYAYDNATYLVMDYSVGIATNYLAVGISGGLCSQSPVQFEPFESSTLLGLFKQKRLSAEHLCFVNPDYFRPYGICYADAASIAGTVSGQSKEFYKSMTKEQSDAFLSKVSKVKIGSSWSEVRQVMGEPDYQATLVPKETPKPKGIARRYYIRKLSKDLVNEIHDESATFVFSPDDILKRIDLKIKR
jgi:hypothetical protein